MQYDYSKFTPTEVLAFPIWKAVCFHICGWNHSFDPLSPEEWAAQFSVFGVGESEVKLAKWIDQFVTNKLSQQ